MDLSNPLKMLETATGVAKALLTAETQVEKAKLQLELAEILSGLAAAKIALIDADAAIIAKDREIAELRQAFEAKGTLIEGPGGYFWVDRGEGKILGYPCCPSCLHKGGQQVPLKQNGRYWQVICPQCDKAFAPVECYLPPNDAGVQTTAADQDRANREKQRLANRGSSREVGGWLR